MIQKNAMWDKLKSYFGKEHKKRNMILGGTAVCLLILVCTSTYSYFSAKDKVENAFTVSELSFEIEEPFWEEPDTPVKPGDVLPKDPQIVNTGSIPFVTRVRIEEVWVPKDGSSNNMVNEDYVRYLSSESQPSTQELLEILKKDQGLAEEDKRFVLRMNLTPTAKGWYRGASQGSEWLYYNKVLGTGERTTPVFNAVTIRTAEDFYNLEDTTVSQTSVMHEVAAENTKIQAMNDALMEPATAEETEDVQAEPTVTEVSDVETPVVENQEEDEGMVAIDSAETGSHENVAEQPADVSLENTAEQVTEETKISNIAQFTPKTEMLDLPTVLTERIVETYEADIEAYNALLTKYDLKIYIYAETVQADPFAWNGEWGDDVPSGWRVIWGGGTQ